MKWIKPSGQEIETNDRKETMDYCKSLGWWQAESEKSKRKRRTKAEIEADEALKDG